MVAGLNQPIKDIATWCFSPRANPSALSVNNRINSNKPLVPPEAMVMQGRQSLVSGDQLQGLPARQLFPPSLRTPPLNRASAAVRGTQEYHPNKSTGILSRIAASAPQLRALWHIEPVGAPAQKFVSLAGAGDTMRYEAGADPLPWDFQLDAHAQGWQPEAAFWMMWFCQRAFSAEQMETQAELKSLGFDEVRCITVPDSGLHALIARCPDRGIVLAFRGTVDFYGWCTDLNFRLSPLDEHGKEKIHKGFNDALDSGWAKIAAEISALSEDKSLPIWVTGHSLGGALATLAAVRLKSDGFTMAPLYTYGAPPVGNHEFCERVEACFPDTYFRVSIDEDMVPRALVDNATWNDINPKTPLLLKPVVAAMQQLIRSAKFTQGGRLVAIQAPHKQLPGARLTPDSCEASRHDIRQFWHGLQKEGADVWSALGRQGRCHDNQAYLASLSKAIKPDDLQIRKN